MFDPPGCSVYYMRLGLYSPQRPYPRAMSRVLDYMALAEADFLASTERFTYNILYSYVLAKCPYDIIYANLHPYRTRSLVRYMLWEPSTYRGVPMCSYARRTNCWRPRMRTAPVKKLPRIMVFHSSKPTPVYLRGLRKEYDVSIETVYNPWRFCNVPDVRKRFLCPIERAVRSRLVIFTRSYRCRWDYEPLFSIAEAMGVPVLVEEGGSCERWVPVNRRIKRGELGIIRSILDRWDWDPGGELFEDDDTAMPATFHLPFNTLMIDLNQYIFHKPRILFDGVT